MPVDKFGRMNDAKTRHTGVSLTYINNDYIRNDGSTPVTDSINMNGNTLYNVTDPVNPQDVSKYIMGIAGQKSLFWSQNLICLRKFPCLSSKIPFPSLSIPPNPHKIFF